MSGPAPPPSLTEQQAALRALEDLEMRKAKLHAEGIVARAEIHRLWSRERSGTVEMEVAGTALIGQIRAAQELSDANRTEENFPQLKALLAEGLVFVPAFEAIMLATRRCTPEVQAGVDARLADQVIGTNVTDVRRMVAHTILAVEAEIDPKLTQERLDQAKKDATVWVSRQSDGMTAVGATLDAVVGRRWAVDFDQLVKAQRVLDKRAGRERSLDAVKVEVFGHLPTLVLELVRAARDGRLGQLAELSELDPQAAAELEQLALDTVDLPLPDETPAPAAEEIVVEEDPFDADAVLDPLAELEWPPIESLDPPAEDPTPPGPPPWDRAAQDAAFWKTASPAPPQDPLVEVLILRCLQMPLQTPTVVNLHIPMATALDLTDAPGILDGHGPLDARRIRELLPDAHLREVYVDRDVGTPLGVGKVERARPGQAGLEDLARRIRPVTLTDKVEPQHDPSVALTEFVKLRDQRCDGPGCTMPASRCDLDHEDEWPDGPTAEWNLKDRSRRCHGAKHDGWQAERHPEGTSEWISPTGRTYISRSSWQPPPRFRKPPYQIHLPRQDTIIEIETVHSAT